MNTALKWVMKFFSEWPERENICQELRYTLSSDPKYEVLTPDNNEVTVNIDTYKRISVGVEFYIVNKATRKIFYMVTPPEEYYPRLGRYFYSYEIKDEETGEWISKEPSRTIYDYPQADAIAYRRSYNNFE